MHFWQFLKVENRGLCAMTIEGPEAEGEGDEEAHHACRLERTLKRVPFLHHKRNRDGDDGDQKTPEHKLDIRFSGQVGARKWDFIKADKIQFGQDVPN